MTTLEGNDKMILSCQPFILFLTILMIMITNVSFILKIKMHSCLSFNSTNHRKFPFVYGDSETKSIKVTKEEQYHE